MKQVRPMKDFNLFDFFNLLAEHLTKKRTLYILYVESYYLRKIKDILLENLNAIPEYISGFSFHSNGFLLIVEDPKTTLRIIRNKLKEHYNFPVGLTHGKIPVKKVPKSVPGLFHEIFRQISNKRRYIPLPSENEISTFIDKLKRQERIKVDINPQNANFILDNLKAILESKTKVIEKNGKFFLKFKNENAFREVEIIYDKESPEVRLNRISIVSAQKILESYFISQSIQRAALEFLIYRSVGNFSLFMRLLDFGVKNGIFEWDEEAGWVLKKEKIHLLNELYPMENRINYDLLNNNEKLVFYTLITSGHELYLKDLYTAINELTGKELKDAIKSLQDKKLVISDPQKIFTTHPTIDEIIDQNFRKSRIKDIHKKLAEILHKRRMSGAKIPAWQIARHFELSGDKRGALKYYTESAEEELKNGNYDRALDQVNRALALCKTQKKKAELWKMKIDAIIEKGDLGSLPSILRETEKHDNISSNINYKTKKAEMLILLDKIRDAEKILKNQVRLRGPSNQKLFLLKVKCDLLLEKLSEREIILMKKLTQNTNVEIKRVLLELFGDISIYMGNVHEAIDYYEQSLKLPAKPWQSLETELKLCTAYFLNFEFYKAFYFLEKILWQSNELNHTQAKNKVLQGVLRCYLVLLPQKSLEKFFRLFLEDMIRTYSSNFNLFRYFGIYYFKKNEIEKAIPLLEKDLENTKKSGNLYEYNQTLIHVAVLLAQFGETDLARKYISQVKSRSKFINQQKQICEMLLKLKKGEEIDFHILESQVLLNGANTLIFYRLTGQIDSPEIRKIQERLSEKVHLFRTILEELDLSAD